MLLGLLSGKPSDRQTVSLLVAAVDFINKKRKIPATRNKEKKL